MTLAWLKQRINCVLYGHRYVLVRNKGFFCVYCNKKRQVYIP